MARNTVLRPLLLLALAVGLLTVSCRGEPSGQYGVRFQLLLMTDRLPDIVSHDFVNDYPGGVAAAMDDSVILPLTEPIEQHAPHLHAFLAGHPEIAEQLATPDGRYFCVPSLVLDESSMSYMGPFVRQDLLERHGLQVPQTLSDWETMLAAFAADPHIDLPLSFYGGHFRSTHFLLGSYGIAWGFFLRGDRVAYGPLEPEFPPALQRLRDWFQAGWIDPGVTFNSRSAYNRRIANRTVGAYVDYVSAIQLYQDRLRIDDPGATLIPVPYPALEGSSTPVIGYRSGSFVPFAAAYLSGRNDAVATSMRVLDYAYSAEGHVLFNYGVLGESYTMVDGRPTLDDRLFAPKGSSSLLRYYLVAGPYLRDGASFQQSLHLDAQREAVHLWSQTDAAGVQLPLLIPDPEHGRALSRVTSALEKYVENSLVAFLTGDRDESQIDAFVSELRSAGGARADHRLSVGLLAAHHRPGLRDQHGSGGPDATSVRRSVTGGRVDRAADPHRSRRRRDDGVRQH